MKAKINGIHSRSSFQFGSHRLRKPRRRDAPENNMTPWAQRRTPWLMEGRQALGANKYKSKPSDRELQGTLDLCITLASWPIEFPVLKMLRPHEA